MQYKGPRYTYDKRLDDAFAENPLNLEKARWLTDAEAKGVLINTCISKSNNVLERSAHAKESIYGRERRDLYKFYLNIEHWSGVGQKSIWAIRDHIAAFVDIKATPHTLVLNNLSFAKTFNYATHRDEFVGYFVNFKIVPNVVVIGKCMFDFCRNDADLTMLMQGVFLNMDDTRHPLKHLHGQSLTFINPLNPRTQVTHIDRSEGKLRMFADKAAFDKEDCVQMDIYRESKNTYRISLIARDTVCGFETFSCNTFGVYEDAERKSRDTCVMGKVVEPLVTELLKRLRRDDLSLSDGIHLVVDSIDVYTETDSNCFVHLLKTLKPVLVSLRIQNMVVTPALWKEITGVLETLSELRSVSLVGIHSPSMEERRRSFVFESPSYSPSYKHMLLNEAVKGSLVIDTELFTKRFPFNMTGSKLEKIQVYDVTGISLISILHSVREPRDDSEMVLLYSSMYEAFNKTLYYRKNGMRKIDIRGELERLTDRTLQEHLLGRYTHSASFSFNFIENPFGEKWDSLIDEMIREFDIALDSGVSNLNTWVEHVRSPTFNNPGLWDTRHHTLPSPR